jgi:general secretion pathway protein D
MQERTCPSHRSRWTVGAGGALAITLAALAPAVAQAQAMRRDAPLRTPQPGGAPSPTTPAPGAPPAPAPAAAAGGAPSGPAASPGGVPPDPAAPADPFAGLAAKPDLDHKPKKPGELVTFNFDDADLATLVKAVAEATGKRFIFGGKVRQIKFTVVAPGKVTVAEAFQAFLSILETNGLTVVPHGRYYKIVETTGIAAQTLSVLPPATPVPDEDRFITRLYRLAHVDAGEMANILGKFKSKDADLTVFAPGNMLIITDTGANIRRMLRIMEELDAGGAGDQLWLQPIHHVRAADLAARLQELLDLGQGGKARIVADDRTNTLVLVATEGDYFRVLEIVKRIDVPSGEATSIHVLPLQHADCQELSSTLGGIVQGLGGGGTAAGRQPAQAGRGGQQPARRTPAAAPGGGGAPAEDVFEGEVRVTCDVGTNALVTVSSLRDYAQLRAVIDQLDRPRRQVFLEAVVMDVNVDHTRSFGPAYHGGAPVGDSLMFGGFDVQKSITSTPGSLEALAFGVRGPEIAGSQNLRIGGATGLSIPAFGVVLHALAKSGDSNVLATPHVLATDNISAEISIGQNIPLQTGLGGGNLGALLAGAQGGQQQPGGANLAGLAALGGLGGGFGFQAPRQDIGIKLTIVPHINDSDQVRMEITEEISDAGSPRGVLEAVPINKRTAKTTVIVRDQQTVVIGGLVRESQVNAESKIPVLGDIPVLGLLFKQTTKTTQKTNLLLILTPHIVRDQDDLRDIFERKMQQRQDFLDRYFVFSDQLAWEPPHDYSRANGLVEHIRRTQREIEEHEKLAAELKPEGAKAHEPVKPLALPSMAGSGGGRGGAAGGPVTAPASGTATTPKPPRRGGKPELPQGRITVPGARPPVTERTE